MLIEAYGRTGRGDARERRRGRAAPARVSALQEQLAYLEASSPFYRERLRGVREHVRTAADLPPPAVHHQGGAARGPAAEPPFGPHLCAPRERLVRVHVTSGTTGEPVAVGFTQRDHEANSAVGGEAFRIAGLRPDDVVAHCLNYALYAGGIADHMALEASGATVVPVGTGQSRAAARPDPAARHHRDLRHALVSRLPRRPSARGGHGAARAGRCATS